MCVGRRGQITHRYIAVQKWIAVNPKKLIDATLAKGKVVMVSGGAFTVEPGGFSNCFRLNFSMPTHEQIRRGVAVIRECVDEMLNA